MKLLLPDVTLVMADTRCHELARLAVLDCMAQVDFGEVIICSDRDFELPGTKFVLVEDWPNKTVAQEFVWRTIPMLVSTSHHLFCEWDAWVLDAKFWSPAFLNYDFIGAPWLGYQGNRDIGNGGFSLRSTRMARHIVEYDKKYPVKYPFSWDTLLCTEYRPLLEAEGFVWPSLELAKQFAFETYHDNFDTFGFHALYNWPMVLSGQRLRERVEIARRTDHIRRTQAVHLERLPSWAT